MLVCIDLTWGPLLCCTPSVSQASLVHRGRALRGASPRAGPRWTPACRLATHKKEGFSRPPFMCVDQGGSLPHKCPRGIPSDPLAGWAPQEAALLVREARKEVAAGRASVFHDWPTAECANWQPRSREQGVWLEGSPSSYWGSHHLGVWEGAGARNCPTRSS